MDTQKIETINQIVQSEEYLKNKDIILDFLKDRELRYYFLSKLPKKTENLNEINFLLEELVKDERPFEVFNILKESISEKNNDLVIKFIQTHYKELGGKLGDNMFQVESLRIIKKIIEQYPDMVDNIFILIGKILGLRGEVYKKSETKREYDEEKKLVSEILKQAVQIYKKNEENQKIKEVIKFIYKYFNLVGDDGEFGHYTPDDIFDILKSHLIENWNKFEEKLREFKRVLIKQYEELYKKFNGWEPIGGTTTSWGHSYRVWDRHFLMFTLKPALDEYYKEKREDAWKFILTNCISKTEKVSKAKPDFLNRAVTPIVLERYENGNDKISEEAFEILKEFILSKRGIPHKTDLIYQALKGQPKLSDDKKWKLVEITTKKYGFPVSVFLEGIVSQLAKGGYEEAKNELKRWFNNPKYYGRFRMEINIVQNVRALLESDFDFAVELFENFIWNEKFIKEYDSFETYEIAVLLYDIFKKNPDKGLEIINKLVVKKNPSKNQQIILCFSLFNYRGNDQSDDIELVDKIYKEFINLFLNGLGNDIDKICNKLTFSQAREALVQFAERLARNQRIEEALRIIKVFVNDPDPYLPGKDPEDPENKYNEHQRILNGEEPGTITSTRGWCGWVLMKCSVLAGRDYIQELIDLTEKLTKDENWYVRHMACFALSQLAQNRLTVLPDNREVLFFGKDKEEALERAKRVEKIAFRLLDDIARASDSVKKALAKSVLTAFDHIRILNEKDALTFVNTLKEFPDEAIAEAAPLFIFFAEFRKDAFRDWRWKTGKYYNDLGPDKYDDEKFKKILLEVIDKIEPKQRFSFAAQFEHLIRDLDYKRGDAERLFEVGYYYLDYLTKEYNHDLSNIIYMTIKNEMGEKHHFDRWYELYIKCLNKEKEFYDKNFKKDKTMEMSWWPSLYNEDILMLLYQYGEKEKFLEVFDTITQFPKELEIHDSDKVVSLLGEFTKPNKTVRVIIKRLFERNPSRYYEFKKKYESNG